MEVQFVDRILICSDCSGEFIFTAGEQLFFHDKQFKNDPKRCKPCKSRRTGLAVGASGGSPAAAGLSRTETRTECSECGVQTTVPFKPTQGRPVLCRQCFQIRSKAASSATGAKPAGAAPMTPVETASALSSAAAEPDGGSISANDAVGAVASMPAASPKSSVVSAADLAPIKTAHPMSASSQIPTELLAAAGSERAPAEQIASRVEASDA